MVGGDGKEEKISIVETRRRYKVRDTTREIHIVKLYRFGTIYLQQ